jgi:hypothetical protein
MPQLTISLPHTPTNKQTLAAAVCLYLVMGRKQTPLQLVALALLLSACACHLVTERERERESVCVCVCDFEGKGA